MKTDIFDYPLHEDLIAQEPAQERDLSRLMLVDRKTGALSHHVFKDLVRLLNHGDCIVVNTSRVFPGRLRARKKGSGGRVEVLLLERIKPGIWRALFGGASLSQGVRLELESSEVIGELTEGPFQGKGIIRFELPDKDVDIDELIFAVGRTPLPPYIKKEVKDVERYQTVFNGREISAAAPTAGLHFTRELLEELQSSGVETARLELAVGLDTFAPVKEVMIEDHKIHSEWFRIGEDCAGLINETRGSGGRVVAVGTTVVRALESAALESGEVAGREGRTELFIAPGYEFKAVDAIITNFHFPRSTPLMLVCAFGGTRKILDAYGEAIRERYRMYSFGDAMMVV